MAISFCNYFMHQRVHVPVTPETALKSYLQNGDETSFAWEIQGSQDIKWPDCIFIDSYFPEWREIQLEAHSNGPCT